jgi:hypothetical protein
MGSGLATKSLTAAPEVITAGEELATSGSRVLAAGAETAPEAATLAGDGAKVLASEGSALTTTSSSAAGTGAFMPGVEGTGDLGKFAEGSFNVSKKGLGIVEDHLAQFGDVPENSMMIDRLKTAVESGSKITGADASFYFHEVSEATMMGRGLSYEVAHPAALAKYGVSPFSVYHPDVISALPESFGPNWKLFWGLK